MFNKERARCALFFVSKFEGKGRKLLDRRHRRRRAATYLGLTASEHHGPPLCYGLFPNNLFQNFRKKAITKSYVSEILFPKETKLQHEKSFRTKDTAVFYKDTFAIPEIRSRKKDAWYVHFQ